MNMEKFISSMAEKAEKSIGKSENDYVKDGILYCGNCNTAKQTKISFCGHEKIVFCLCKCEQEKQNEEDRIEKEEKRRIEIRDLRSRGISDIKARHYSFQNAEDTKYIQMCRRYVKNWEKMYEKNISLLFWGGPGGGKTFAAGCIANALIDQGIPVLVTSFPRIINSGYDKTDILAAVRSNDLVVFDDLGAERQSQYALETVYSVIDERCRANKPMIITTNLNYSDMDNPKNIEYYRIYDRFLGVCEPVLFNENSRRKKQGEEKRKIAKEILGI